ncbi:uncharacterized protein LOC101739580 isoform X2 [Bombyx mori]|uniref:Uncharacterized protein n=1 Tax=Bombyx mori TaxID=7091 RepID=A0A8R2DJF2_BOMMO|nr:uncharacterized protein LOC101739580 isoform X2 [Bombyx mori]
MTSTVTSTNLIKYKISRRGRKLQVFDDQRTLIALPKDVQERTWAEILQKEDDDLLIFEIREEILEEAMSICYERYMEKQTSAFTIHIAAQAWLKLINWEFYRHDPGEDSSAYPPCYIPNRVESWIPDELPEPSPKDTWAKHDLKVLEQPPEESLRKSSSSSSIEYPVVEEIPPEYWFPGKVNIPDEWKTVREEVLQRAISYDTSDTEPSSEPIGAESEVLQKITDYSSDNVSTKESSFSALKTTTPVEGSLHGAGDSTVVRQKRRLTDKSKSFSKASMLGRSKGLLPPLDLGDSRSRMSVISDCRLRNLRLDTQYEISSEKVDTPQGGVVKRK